MVMNSVLNDILKRIFASGEFKKTINSPIATKEDPLFDFFSLKIPSDLLTIVDRNLYTASGSIGKGNRLHSYWFAIFDKRITSSAAKGVYVVYLLSYDGTRLYLTLNQGSDGVESLNTRGLKDRAEKIAGQLLNVGGFATGPVNLEENAKGRTLNFSVGSIFSKEYRKGESVPSEESLRKDLNDMLEIYREYAEKNGYRNSGEKNDFVSVLNGMENKDELNLMQKIIFGAPGTGKSHKANQIAPKEDLVTFRTTFHPDYDYAQFVGSYKPKKEGSSITYSFVPQVLAKAYVAAWNKFVAADKKSTADNQVYLVIEEINRGSCAQIFGDLFQLLDRDENGYSSYEIDADADFADWIKKQLDSSAAPQNDIPEEIRSGRKLRLPPNFNILATMNTSDQSLFPMDSAFKRRFDWEYVPIDFEGKDCADYQIEVGGEKPYPWQKFVESVNEKIVSITDSEDKQLGEYFIKLNPVDNNVITKERFLGKVMFYLWNEVCKDVHKQESFFREEENGNYFTFQDLYKKDGDKKLISFMDWITK